MVLVLVLVQVQLESLMLYSLGWIGLPSVSIKNLISKCPVLEFLSLKKCWNISSLHVIAPRLKTLIVENCFPPSLDIITIKAPNLLSLKYSGEATTIFVFDEISSELQEAELNYGVEKKFIEAGDILVEKLYYISSIKTLTVCNYMLKVIHNGEDPLFIKSSLAVKHLILKTALEREDFYGVTELTLGFEHPFPIKEHQFISSKQQTITIGGSQWQPRLIDCMETLSTITIKGFKANPDELLVMRYFFKNGSKVRTMYVGIPSEADDDERAKYKRAARSLLMFRWSTNQRLEFF
ncbi:hypothetical protein M9H77_00097 [Catharanthus roseus]|nr:hypothetical protein M9H77_00096 [Catharanthus roseus]KAI5641692.1 hypothetical protein M9H77_00097 [Catharanthus roseus]